LKAPARLKVQRSCLVRIDKVGFTSVLGEQYPDEVYFLMPGQLNIIFIGLTPHISYAECMSVET